MNKGVSTKQVEEFTKKKILSLIEQAKKNKKVLADLRHGIGKKPGEIPQLWGYFLDSMPEGFFGEGEPSKAEWAIYTSITLFSLHQQGKELDTELMYQEGQTFGCAVSKLINEGIDGIDNNRERVLRRFYPIVTANSIEELSHYMRSMIQIIRSDRNGIGLDYVDLAGDLYLFQFPQYISNIRLKWGQDFYRNRSNEN